MAQVISIINEKGGVGKTTTTGSLGSILASKGYRVIMIDIDPQSDLTLSCSFEYDPRINIFNCLFELNKPKGIKLNPNLILIPGSERLQPLEFADRLKLHPQYQLENPRLILRSFIEPLLKKSDFILIDCPPNQEIVVLNALVASNYVMIPTMPHSFSLNGINTMLSLVQRFTKLNHDLQVLGILVNNYDKRNNIDQAVYELCKDKYASLLFSTPIRINTKLKESTHLSIEIVKYNEQLQEKKIPQEFPGFEDFCNVADEILSRLKIPANK